MDDHQKIRDDDTSATDRKRSGRMRYALIGAVISVLAFLVFINLQDNQPIASPPNDAKKNPPAADSPVKQTQPARVGSIGTHIIIHEEPELTGIEIPKPPLTAPQPKKLVDLTDEECSKMSIGTWISEKDGVRILTIRNDGTATMIYKPIQLKQLLLGEKVTIEITWEIEDHVVKFTSISGVPESSFKTITTIYGREMNRRILQLSAEAFTLQDLKDMHESEWSRVSHAEKNAS